MTRNLKYRSHIQDILDHVGEDFFTFQEFKDSDFNSKNNILKRSEMVVRYVQYCKYKGKSPIQAIKLAFKFNYNFRTFKKLAKMYEGYIWSFCQGKGFLLNPEKQSDALNKIYNDESRSLDDNQCMLVWNFLRGKYDRCSWCQKWKPKSRKFCTRSCKHQSDHAEFLFYVNLFQSSPEVLARIDVLHYHSARSRKMGNEFYSRFRPACEELGYNFFEEIDKDDPEYDFMHNLSRNGIHEFMHQYKNKLNELRDTNPVAWAIGWYDRWYKMSDDDFIEEYKKWVLMRNGVYEPEFEIIRENKNLIRARRYVATNETNVA